MLRILQTNGSIPLLSGCQHRFRSEPREEMSSSQLAKRTLTSHSLRTRFSKRADGYSSVLKSSTSSTTPILPTFQAEPHSRRLSDVTPPPRILVRFNSLSNSCSESSGDGSV